MQELQRARDHVVYTPAIHGVVHGPAASAAREAGAKQKQTGGRGMGRRSGSRWLLLPQRLSVAFIGSFPNTPGAHLLLSGPAAYCSDGLSQPDWLSLSSAPVSLSHHGSFPRSPKQQVSSGLEMKGPAFKKRNATWCRI